MKYYKFLLFSVLSFNLFSNCTKAMEEEKDLFRKGIITFNMKKYTESKQALKPLAQRGHSYAQYIIGQIYEFGGDGIEKSLSKAKKLYVSSVLNGCKDAVPAMIRIGEKERKHKIKEEKTYDNTDMLIKKYK